MSVERSHGKTRLRPRTLRALKAPPSLAGGEPRPAHARPHRTARRSLLATVRAAAEQEVGGTVVDGRAPSEAAELAKQALRLFRAGKREIGSDSLTACTLLLAWAMGSAVAQHLTLAGAVAGLSSDRGLALLERAAKSQGRAERSWCAAITAAGLLDGRRETGIAPQDLARLLREAAKPRESTP